MTFMLLDKTREFEEHFGGDKIDFPTDDWMECFDKQEEENDTHDEQHKGFKNGDAVLFLEERLCCNQQRRARRVTRI